MSNGGWPGVCLLIAPPPHFGPARAKSLERRFLQLPKGYKAKLPLHMVVLQSAFSVWGGWATRSVMSVPRAQKISHTSRRGSVGERKYKPSSAFPCVRDVLAGVGVISHSFSGALVEPAYRS